LVADEDRKRRWYLIHAFVNTFIAISVLGDFYMCIILPLESFTPTDLTIPVTSSIALHIYHIATSIDSMDIIDWVHHLVSNFLVGAIALFALPCRIVNYILFFICGFPGGVDYYLLALNKYQIIDRMTEKKINVDLNMWIRMPGILYSCFLGWVCYVYSAHNFSEFLILLTAFLDFFNCIYFASRVAQNYGYSIGKNTIPTTKINEDGTHVNIEFTEYKKNYNNFN